MIITPVLKLRREYLHLQITMASGVVSSGTVSEHVGNTIEMHLKL